MSLARFIVHRTEPRCPAVREEKRFPYSWVKVLRDGDELRDAVGPVTHALFPDMPTVNVVLAVQAWTTLVGIISLEVFGHWRNTIIEPEEFFEATISDLAATVGLS